MAPNMDMKTVFIGNLLLTFGAETRGTSGRTDAGLTCLKREGCWQLTAHQPSEMWKGSPFQSGETETGTFWFLGELYGATNLEAERLLRDLVEGKTAARTLNGHFLLLAWNGQARQWHIWTDRF